LSRVEPAEVRELSLEDVPPRVGHHAPFVAWSCRASFPP
jgi:hypothetical protein